MRFYDRHSEMQTLERMYELSEQAKHMLVVLGRRRIGKTRLIKEFIRGKKAFYFFVERSSGAMLLRRISEELARMMPGKVVGTLDWESAFKILLEEFDVVVLDEFQNILSVDESALSILQRVWDEFKGGTLLILVGSYQTMMKKIFEDYRTPLYGRSSGRLRVEPLSYKYVRKMLLDMKFQGEENLMNIYSILGGVPLYYEFIERFDISGTWKDVVKSMFIEEPRPLIDEPHVLLVGEFGRQQSTYMSILEAIAKGKSTMTEIANATGILEKSLGKYLKELSQDYEIIERKVPMFSPPNSKRGRYFLRDPFLTFWFRFIYPNMSMIELGQGDALIRSIEEGINAHTGRIFEKVVAEIIAEQFKPLRIGSWWNRRGDEIDIVADLGNEVLFVECKWRNRKIAWGTVEELMRKSELVKMDSSKKRRYMIVSKSGFTENCRKEMDKEGIMHWDLSDLERMMKTAR